MQPRWLWTIALLLVVGVGGLSVAWTTRYRVVTTRDQGVVLYDRWTHRLCWLTGSASQCGPALP